MNRRYLAQRLLNEGHLSQKELAELLRQRSFGAFEKAAASLEGTDEHPAMTAVRRLAGPELQMEVEAYSEYMELLMDSLMDFLEAPAVIDTQMVPPDETSAVFYAVSQRMDGDMSIVSGIMAESREFAELATRYSEEQFDAPEDEYAMDSLEEFLNVVNGVFSVREAVKDEEIDLEVPRHGKLMNPMGNQQLVLRVYADFGMFYVVLATDEFM